ncbi:MAG: hypothetical protein IPM56_00450 [Ignavibacteriales bacterium]|nr:MAG: hypothetical protein IPM56_00450 [Ignavibacteriales bacterium]
MEQEDNLGVRYTRLAKIAATILDILLFLLILFHFFFANLPSITEFSSDKLLILFSSIITLIGFIIGYKFDGVGGLIICYGFLLFWIINITHNYNFHFEWLTTLTPISGIIHLFIWRRTDGKKYFNRM